MPQASTPTRSRGYEKPRLTAEQWARIEERAEAEEAAIMASEHASRMLSSGIPHEFRGAEVSDGRVAQWLEEPGYGLLLKGLPDRGKTHEACAALASLARSGPIRFVSADDLARGYSSCRETRDAQTAYLNAYRAVAFLAIDDLGKEEDRFGSPQAILSVIDRRGQAMRPTIVTTNLDGRAMLERYARSGIAEALISRLSRYEIAEIGGSDRRRMS